MMFHTFVLAFALIGGALVGPLHNIVPCKGIHLKLAWRFQSISIILITWFLAEKIYNVFKCPDKKIPKLTHPND